MPRSRPSRIDRRRVEQALQSARDAVAIAGGRSAEELAADMPGRRALVNCFTEIGEAVHTMSDAAQRVVGDFPWRGVVGLRNMLVHDYWSIDYPRLIRVVHDDLPPLITALRRALDHWPA
ncbi:MAG: DUF86 domain-containing protein [Phycisphaerales bacterium]|nr:DUF86 domain-containing protein [Phycisphaerales bacterium]